MWRDTLAELFDDVQLHPPATTDQIRVVEARVCEAFPNDLRDLLLETDGFQADSGMLCVFGVARRQPEDFVTVYTELFGTDEYRTLYKSFDRLLFFASDGMGGYFAYDLRRSGVIVHWDHEEDTRLDCTDAGLADFLRRYVRREVYDQ